MNNRANEGLELPPLAQFNASRRRSSFGGILLSALKNNQQCVHFSDIQLMEQQQQQPQDSEEVVLRPKLLKQQRTEGTPPHSPALASGSRIKGIMKNGGMNVSRGSESIELPNADGKFNDNNVSPTINAGSSSRRRSVFVRLKTFVMKSVSFEDSESGNHVVAY